MVAAVHFLATSDDHVAMLDYLREPEAVTLHPWPAVSIPAVTWTRERAVVARQVMIVHRDLGPASVIRPGEPAMAEGTKAGVFNRLNWERLSPGGEDGLVDSNTSPVILWEPGKWRTACSAEAHSDPKLTRCRPSVPTTSAG